MSSVVNAEELTVEQLDVYDKMKRYGAAMTFTGPVTEKSDMNRVTMTLTCGCKLIFLRYIITPPAYAEEFYCPRCDDFKKIRFLSNWHAGFHALELFPSSQYTGAVWKHVKSAGSGRA